MSDRFSLKQKRLIETGRVIYCWLTGISFVSFFLLPSCFINSWSGKALLLAVHGLAACHSLGASRRVRVLRMALG